MYYITIQDVKAIIGDLDLRLHRDVHRHHGERPDARPDALLPPDVQEAPCDVLHRHDWDGEHAGDCDGESAADNASAAAEAVEDTTCPR